MKPLPDQQNRIRALTDRGATLMVEAAAGTGKTALLAGRVVVLLANGAAPREIAAITFTEFAAGELRERITRFISDVLVGEIPDELTLAFRSEVPPAQKEALRAAREHLDELTCSTIHRFCHDLLRIYAVEAGIDPGAEILDEVQGELAYASIFERWLRGRLDELGARDDPVTRVAEMNPISAEKLLRELAKFRREHRSARPLPGDIDPNMDRRLWRVSKPFGAGLMACRVPTERPQMFVSWSNWPRIIRVNSITFPALTPYGGLRIHRACQSCARGNSTSIVTSAGELGGAAGVPLRRRGSRMRLPRITTAALMHFANCLDGSRQPSSICSGRSLTAYGRALSASSGTRPCSTLTTFCTQHGMCSGELRTFVRRQPGASGES